MSLRYIIDGYNLLNHPHLNLKGKSVFSPARVILSLIRQNSLSGSVKNKVLVVFDGYPPAGEPPAEQAHERVIFSRLISADEKIKKMVEESAGRKEIVVVSDDKEIIFYIRSLGARSMSLQEFLQTKRGVRQSKTSQPEPELTSGQMRDINNELKDIWLKDEGRRTKNEECKTQSAKRKT